MAELHIFTMDKSSPFLRTFCLGKSNVNLKATSLSLRVFLDIWWEENACSYWVQYNTKQNTMCEIQNKTSCKTWHILICSNSAPELTFITKNWIWIFEGQNFLINLNSPSTCHQEIYIVMNIRLQKYNQLVQCKNYMQPRWTMDMEKAKDIAFRTLIF